MQAMLEGISLKTKLTSSSLNSNVLTFTMEVKALNLKTQKTLGLRI